jgi:hypothetical protein
MLDPRNLIQMATRCYWFWVVYVDFVFINIVVLFVNDDCVGCLFVKHLFVEVAYKKHFTMLLLTVILCWTILPLL